MTIDTSGESFFELKEEMFGYLYALRDSGLINMFEAPRHIRENYGLDKKQSYAVFQEWTEEVNSQSE